MAAIQDVVSFGEQQEESIPSMSVQLSNLKANFNATDYSEELQIIVECLKNSPVQSAMTISREMPQRLINLAVSTAKYVKESNRVSFEVIGNKTFHLTKSNFVKMLGFSLEDSFYTPSAEELINMFNQMGYTPMMTKISQFKKNILPFIWNFFFTVFKRCLCGRRSGLDAASQLFLTALYGVYYNVKVDYGSILWYEFIESLKVLQTHSEVSSHRYWSLIVHTAYMISKTTYDADEESEMKIHQFQTSVKANDQKEFDFVGKVPKSMYSIIPQTSVVLLKYKSQTDSSFKIRAIPDAILKEIQAQNVKVPSKRKELAESSVPMIEKPHKKKRSKLTKMILTDEEDENEEVGTKIMDEGLLGIENEEVVTEVDTGLVNPEVVTEVDTGLVNPEVVTEADTELVNPEVVEETAFDDSDVNKQIVSSASETPVVVTFVVSKNVIPDVGGSEQTNLNDNIEIEKVIHNVTKDVSEAIHITESESSIFKDLQSLNVSIPNNSPVIPPMSEGAPILEDLVDESYIALSEDEEFELAPIQDMEDENDDSNDDQFTKQREVQKEAEIESIVVDFHAKLEAQSHKIQKLVDEFGDFKDKLFTDVENLKLVCEDLKLDIQRLNNSEVHEVCATIENKLQSLEGVIQKGDEKVNSLREEVLHVEGMFENEFHRKMEEAMVREGNLQKLVDESLAHIKVLEASIKTYDDKEISDAYNEKVVKHVEMVQQDFIARLSPLINFVSKIPKTKVGSSEQSMSKPFKKMDMPLFKSIQQDSLLISSTTTNSPKPQMISQAFSFPMVSHTFPETAERTLVVARNLSKGISIGSTVPIFSTSTIISTIGEGSTLQSTDKGKGLISELSKEERKRKENEDQLRFIQQLSLVKQGEHLDQLQMVGEAKIWSEATIRDIAFGEGEFFNMLPKESYEVDLSHNQQLDLPLLPILFTVKCFMVKPSLRLLSPEYEEKLIRFYGCVGKLESEVWSSKPIIRVKKIVPYGLFDEVFENMNFTVLRTDNVEYSFTFADFPTMNPSDLIKLYKMFRNMEKVDIVIITAHLRRRLRAYVESFAKKDMAVSREFFTRLRKPVISQSGISKERDGKIIHNPDWGVVSCAKVKGKFVKSFLRIDEKGLFDTEVLESILRRINQNDDNSVKEKREVEDLLRWWIAVRKDILEVGRLVFGS